MSLIALMDLIALIGPSGTAGLPLNIKVAMIRSPDFKKEINEW